MKRLTDLKQGNEFYQIYTQFGIPTIRRLVCFSDATYTNGVFRIPYNKENKIAVVQPLESLNTDFFDLCSENSSFYWVLSTDLNKIKKYVSKLNCDITKVLNEIYKYEIS